MNTKDTIIISVFYQCEDDNHSIPQGITFQIENSTEEEAIEKVKRWIYEDRIKDLDDPDCTYENSQSQFTVYDKDCKYTEYRDEEGYVLQVSKLITL